MKERHEHWFERQLDKASRAVANWPNDVRLAMGLEPLSDDAIYERELRRVAEGLRARGLVEEATAVSAIADDLPTQSGEGG